MDKYQTILRKAGLKATIQRLKILQYLDRQHDHATIDSIYEALVKDNPSLSKTTVYNTIDQLKKHGLISTLSITGKELLCEYGCESHHHFYCNKCEKTYDIHTKCQYCNARQIDGHRIDEIHGYFKGTCKNCIAQKKKK